jgi:large subunit ribosomal protein L22
MEAVAYLRYSRISPRKVSIVLDLIRNKPTNVALAILKNTPKIASEPLEKLLKSAIANADNNNHMDTTKLFVSKCFVCPGPTLKRIRPRAHGRAFHIMKRTSHITLAVKELDDKD